MSATRGIKVLSTTALKSVLDAMAPSFTRRSGFEVTVSFGPSGRMARLAAEGEPADAVLVTSGGIDELVRLGRVVAGGHADVARSVIGLAVPPKAPRPDISTADAFRHAMLSAVAIAMSNPAGGAQSGAHLAKVFEQLGIAEAMKAKSIYGPGGPAGLVGNYLLRGEAQIGLQQMPELMAVPGIDIVGPIPPELQLVTTFSAGISAAAVEPEGARAWIAHLASAEAAEAIRTAGMEPA